MTTGNPIMRYFAYNHLPEGPLRETSKLFSDLAIELDALLIAGAESATALRKLLEAKDAAVRSALDLPSGRVDLRGPGVTTYYMPEEPPRTMLQDGDVWMTEFGGVAKTWSTEKQDWIGAEQ